MDTRSELVAGNTCKPVQSPEHGPRVVNEIQLQDDQTPVTWSAEHGYTCPHNGLHVGDMTFWKRQQARWSHKQS